MQDNNSAWVAHKTPEPSLEPLAFADLAAAAPPKAAWLWHGYLAKGSVTLLTSQWKTGKTTLLSVLLARLNAGGTLAGLAVEPGIAAIVTEENPAHWRTRGERLGLGPRLSFFCRPFPGKPTRDEWQALVDRLDRLRAEQGLDLVVIDTLSGVIPSGVENHADAMLEVLRPLESLTRAGVAVLILHHPKKGAIQEGQAARGTGALSAYVDVLMEMRHLMRAGTDDRRRRLSAWSRYDETPHGLVIELAADGRDYAVCPDALDEELDQGLMLTRELLARAGQQMTRERIHESWSERPKPNLATLWRWLEKGVERSLISRHGTGRRGDPFRYAYPGCDLPWDPDPEEILGLR